MLAFLFGLGVAVTAECGALGGSGEDPNPDSHSSQNDRAYQSHDPPLARTALDTG